MLLVGDHLVVSVRDIRAGQPRYWIGIYDTENFALQHQMRTNDLLMAARGKRAYFLAGGDPILDEDIFELGPMTVNVYEVRP
jgi:hypothetical protein